MHFGPLSVGHLEKQNLEAMCPNNHDVHALSLNEPMSKNPILGFLTAWVDSRPFFDFCHVNNKLFQNRGRCILAKNPLCLAAPLSILHGES